MGWVDRSLDKSTSKGDLLVYDGSAYQRLAVGSDDHVLTADSVESSGVKWAAAPGGGGGSVPGGSITSPPASGWSWVNQGTSTITTESDGAHTLKAAATGSNNLIGRVRSHSSGDVITAYIAHSFFAGHGGGGLCLRSASGQLTFMYIKPSGGLFWENWSTPTSFSSNVGGRGLPEHFRVWLQFEDDGTDIIARYSPVGYPGSFLTVNSVGRTSFLTGGPVEVGFMVRDNGNIGVMSLFSWAVT